MLADLGDQGGVLLPVQRRGQEARNVLDVLAVPKSRVDEMGQVAELELERGAHAVFPGDAAHALDNVEAVVQVALVIVGQVVDKQVLEKEVSHARLVEGVQACMAAGVQPAS